MKGEDLIPSVGECDGLDVLRRIRSQYYRQANRIAYRHTDPETGVLPEQYHSVIDWYRKQGDLVGKLIPEDKHDIQEGSERDVSGTNGDIKKENQERQETSTDGGAYQEGHISDHLDNLIGHHEDEGGEVYNEVPAAAVSGENQVENGEGIVRV